MTELGGLRIAITGGARGIGRATAIRLAAAGARVVIGDRDADLAATVADELRVRSLPLDVTAAESWREFVGAAGPLDVLVNNAGIMPLGPVVDEPEDVMKAVFEVNTYGVILGTKAVAPGMAQRGFGQIVNVASAVGRVAVAHGATYSASKFAVVGFSEAVRDELAPQGITVSLVLPTVVRTELAAGVPQARFVRSVAADDVARVIEASIRSPRPEMWVPRWTQGVQRAVSVLPRPLQATLAKAFRADSVLTSADPAVRAAYEERARHSGAGHR